MKDADATTEKDRLSDRGRKLLLRSALWFVVSVVLYQGFWGIMNTWQHTDKYAWGALDALLAVIALLTGLGYFVRGAFSLSDAGASARPLTRARRLGRLVSTLLVVWAATLALLVWIFYYGGPERVLG